MIRHNNKHPRRGVMVALFAICLPVMLITAAFFINVAYMELTRTELQIATDSAARAAGRRLAMTGQQTDAVSEGQLAASKNLVGGSPLTLVAADFEFGESTRNSLSSRYTFTPTTGHANAVRVSGRRTASSANGDVQLFLKNFASVDDFETVQQGISTQVELDMAIVIDRSGSMAYSVTEASGSGSPPASAPADWSYGDAAPPDSRWRDALIAVQAFIDEMNATPQDEQITVLTYASNASVDVDFTVNYSELGTALDAYTQSYQNGSTNISAGVEGAIDSLGETGNSRPWAAKAIIILTDGRQTAGSDPVTAAEQAVAQGVSVYTITFSDEADQAKMQSVAQSGLGAHFHADSPADLIEAFRAIAKSLPTLLTK